MYYETFVFDKTVTNKLLVTLLKIPNNHNKPVNE